MQKGDFLKIEYIGRIAATGEVFDLTDPDVAKKEGIYDPKARYGPVLVIVGSGMTPPGVDKQLMGMKPGEEREFPVSQQEGFGRRDPRLIKIVSLQRFYSQKINPVPGIFVNIDGRHARIQSVSGGRDRVDFNSPLAGKDLKYKVKVLERITGPANMGQALIDHYDLKAKVTFKEGNLTIGSQDKLPEQLKNLLNMQIKKWIPGVNKINYLSKGKKGAESKPSEKAEKAQEKNNASLA